MALLSQPGRFEQLASVAPEQQQAIFQMLQQALGQMQDPQSGFKPIADLARQQFNQQTVPGIAERFASMGDNRLGSGAFASQLGQAGAGLESQLAAQGAQYGLQQQGLAQQLAQLGLSPTFQYGYHQPQEGALSKMGTMVAQFGGNALGSYLGGGGSMGNILGSLRSILGGGGGQGGGMAQPAQMNPMANQFNQNYGMAQQAFQPQSSMANLRLLQGGY